jgi:hypothetical protein
VTTVVAKAVADMEVTATVTATVTAVGLGEVSAVAIAGATKEVSQGAIAGAAEKEVPPVPPLSFHSALVAARWVVAGGGEGGREDRGWPPTLPAIALSAAVFAVEYGFGKYS